MDYGLEVDEGIVHSRLGETRTGCSKYSTFWHIRSVSGIGIILEMWICIVIHTIAATEDTVNTTLDILHIGRGCEFWVSGCCLLRIIRIIRIWCNNFIDFALGKIADLVCKVLLTPDFSSQVITSKDIVTYVCKTTAVSLGSVGINLTPHIGLGMS